MPERVLGLNEKLYAYLIENSLRDDPVLRDLRAETARLPMGEMQISPEQGQLMALLAQAIQARRCIEIGTFTGYSSISVARALPPDGRMICCDVSEEYTRIARKYWARAGLADKITLELGPALPTLDRLIAMGEAGRFDFAFIDADKENYRHYYERCLTLLRPGGLILVDNVLWGGSVADKRNKGASTEAIRAFNKRLKNDGRVSLSLLPVGDGLTLALKRAAD
ncbi:MAG TPA: class I SAM-dependent methyltransferase [Alphaproteobacteria bacterium]|nr:class I SAM-dependent methyltransferase [Alphaproteobacteria bacterium]